MFRGCVNLVCYDYKMDKKSGQIRKLWKSCADVVIQKYPGYPDVIRGVCDANLTNNLKLFTNKEILKLSQYPDIKRELADAQSDNVLQYLFVENPSSGMIYGARYRWKQVFHIAKRYYRSNRGLKALRDVISQQVINEAVRGGNVKIFRSCLKYTNFRNFNGWMKTAILYKREKMMNHLIRRGADLAQALHHAHTLEQLDTIEWLIRKCFEKMDTNVVNQYLNRGISRAIADNKYDLFQLYLRYPGIEHTRVLSETMYHNRIDMFDVLLSYVNRHDVDDMYLSNAVFNKNIYMLQKILIRFQYTQQTLMANLIYIIDVTEPDIDVQKRVIDILMDHIENPDIRMILNDTENYEIQQYVLSKL